MKDRVRKAVFPAAGLGTRFLPATKALPKEMLALVDKPLIQYGVEEAIAAGCEQIIIVTGRNKAEIEDHFDISFELEQLLEKRGKTELLAMTRQISHMARIAYVRQKEAMGLGHAVLMARDLVGDEPFAVILPDDIIEAKVPCLQQMMEVFEQTQSSILATQVVEGPSISSYGVLDCDPVEGKERIFDVKGLVEKPKPEEAPSRHAIIGRYILTSRIFDVLEKTPLGAGGELQLTDGIKGLLQNEKVYGYSFDGLRFDAGDKLGMLKATVEFALNHNELGTAFREYLKSLPILTATKVKENRRSLHSATAPVEMTILFRGLIVVFPGKVPSVPCNRICHFDRGASREVEKSAGLYPASGQNVEYPETRKDEQVDDYHGIKVEDPYRWLEDDNSAETMAWVSAQNRVTFDYLEQIPYRSRLKERLQELYNYPKYGIPSRSGAYYIWSKNDGLQNQSVLYVQEGLEGTPRVLIDPNQLSPDGTVRLMAGEASRDGRYFAYYLSSSGSDWLEGHILEIETGTVLNDHLMWLKVTGLAWFRDGFFYSRYDAPGDGHDLSSRNDGHQVYYHRLGTTQADDRLVYEDKAHPQRFHTVETTRTNGSRF